MHLHTPIPPSLTVSSTSNYKQKSLYGFRMSALIGWVAGDSYKYVYHVVRSFRVLTFLRVAYFFVHDSPIQFKVCAIFQLSVDMSKLPPSPYCTGACHSYDQQ